MAAAHDMMSALKSFYLLRDEILIKTKITQILLLLMLRKFGIQTNQLKNN